MRLPIKDGQADNAEFTKPADIFLENGFNCFDTAHGYIGGKSETSARAMLRRNIQRGVAVLPTPPQVRSSPTMTRIWQSGS